MQIKFRELVDSNTSAIIFKDATVSFGFMALYTN